MSSQASSSSYHTAKTHQSPPPPASTSAIREMKSGARCSNITAGPSSLPSVSPILPAQPPDRHANMQTHLRWMLQAVLSQSDAIEALDGRAGELLTSARSTTTSLFEAGQPDDGSPSFSDEDIPSHDPSFTLSEFAPMSVEALSALITSRSVRLEGTSAENEAPACDSSDNASRGPTHIEPLLAEDHLAQGVDIIDENAGLVVERIVGRRGIRRDVDGVKRIFEYLVKWQGFPLGDCTWENKEHIPDCDTHVDLFLRHCEELNVHTRKKVALLPEAHGDWDAVTGTPRPKGEASDQERQQGEADRSN